MPLNYAFDKFNAAARALICLDIPLRDRLGAAIFEVSLITPEKDLPPDLRQSFAEVMEKIHAYRCQPDRPDFPPDVAWSIFEVYKKLLGFTGRF